MDIRTRLGGAAHHLYGRARHVLGHPVPLAYLGLVAAAFVFALVDAAFVSHPDASLAGVWMVLLTFPTVMLPLAAESLVPGGETSGALLLVSVVLSALVQAALLGVLVRTLGRHGAGGNAYGRG
ncbi:hypothetical protein [Streptomyces sp. Z26]|uniref:SCO4225 family membrane protein n=1 Tax=Streptomyces TaxID=1883 RepID=UPI000EF13C50|nr:hypothetical protein [Streptomyces sp. Z26]RLL67392.1 hypothetical protein D7M15_11570 [Streptomyces sp. Z26]